MKFKRLRKKKEIGKILTTITEIAIQLKKKMKQFQMKLSISFIPNILSKQILWGSSPSTTMISWT